MKKVAKVILAAVVAACSSVAFFGCGGNDEHVHNWDTANVTWQWDGTTKATATFTCKDDSSHTESVETTQITNQVTTNATCTADGVRSYTAKANFDGVDYTNVKTAPISATGHSYNVNNIAWTWDGVSAATATVTCANNSSHTQNYTATVTSTTVTAATCDADGVQGYEASVVIDGKTYKNTSQTTGVITATGHSYDMSNIAWRWDGTTSATAVLSCTKDFRHTQTVTATVAPKTITAATCTQNGVSGYEASIVVDGQTYTNLSATTETIKATGHTTSLNETLSKAATCTERGANVYTCANCDYKETQVTNIIDHTWDVEERSCTQGQTCSVCHTTNPALGHTYELISGSGVTTADASQTVNCAEGVVNSYICSRCDDSYEEIIVEPKDHVVETWTESSEEPELKDGETCIYIQIYTGVCTVCGDDSATKEVEVAKHDYKAEITTAPTCTQKGLKTFTCTKCNDKYEVEYAVVDDAHDWVAGSTEGNTTTYTCKNNAEHTKKVLVANTDTKATVTQSDLTAAGEIELQGASIALDNNTLSTIAQNDGDVNISAKSDKVEDLELNLDEDKIEQIGDNPVYNLSMTVGETAVSDLGGKVTVKVPYTLAEGEDPETIAVWYIDGDGNVKPIAATYITENGEGYAVFQTTHFSYYTVTRLTPAERCVLYGHSWVTLDVNTVICTSEAYTLKTCRRCGEKERTVTRAAKAHTYGETTTIAATCTTAGSETKTCSECGYVSTVKLPIKGHAWAQDADKSVAATCQKAGSTLYVCSNDAEHTYTKAIAQKAHNYKKEVVAPTCENEGYTTYTCSYGCGDSYKEDVKVALGHDYEATYYAHTSTAKGYTVYVCQNDTTHTYKVDDQDFAHEWNMANATCVDDKICDICGVVGEQKTGNHTMSNGVCTVCGESPCGGNHTFEAGTEKLDATCTANGYTTEVCSTCGYQKRITVNALGHSGKFVCSVCGEALIDKNLFANTYTSIANSSFTIVIKDISIAISFGSSSSSGSVSEMTVTTESSVDSISYYVELAEIAISFDENGELYATGYGKIKGTMNDMPFDYASEAVFILSGDNVYIDAIVTGTGGTSYGYGTSSGSDKTSEEMLVISFDTISAMTNGMAEQIIDYATEVLSWANEDLAPLFKSAAELNKADVSNVSLRFAETFLDMEKTRNGYTLTIDWDGLAKLNDNLYKYTLAENINLVCGDGAYDAMVEEIVDLLTMPMGDLLTELANKGYDIDDFVSAANEVIKLVFSDDSEEEGIDETTTPTETDSETTAKPITSLQDLYDSFKIGEILKNYFNSESDITLSDLINKDGKVNKRSALDYVNMALALKGSKITITAEMISQRLTLAGQANAYTTVATMLKNYAKLEKSAAELKALVDGVLEIVPDYATATINLDKDGNILSSNINVAEFTAQIGYYSGTFSGNIGVVANYESDVDFAAYLKNVTAVADTIKFDKSFADAMFGTNYVDKATLKVGETTDKTIITFYKSGAIKSIEIHDTSEYVYKTKTQGTTVYKYVTIYNTTKTYYFNENPMLEILPDCGNWYIISIMAIEAKGTTNSTKNVLRTYKNGTMTEKELNNAVSGGTNGISSLSNASSYYYNIVTKKMLAIGSDETIGGIGVDDGVTKHEYYEDKSAEIIAKGHEDWGEKYYVCVNCGDTYVYYYRNGHDDVTITTTFLTETKLCTEGVTISWYCNTCQKTYQSKTYYNHYTIQEITDISEWIPATCTNTSPLYIYRSYCACGYYDEYVGVGGDYDFDYIGYYSNSYTCSDGCGLAIVDTYTTKADPNNICNRITTHMIVISNGDQALTSMQILANSSYHTGMTYAKLSGKTCEDGVTVTRKCIVCGKSIYSYTTKDHDNAVLWEYDLSSYGTCGEKIYVVGDPCGSKYDGKNSLSAWYYIFDDAGKEKDNGGIQGYFDENNRSTYMYTCPVDDCKLKVLFVWELQSDCTVKWTVSAYSSDGTRTTLVNNLYVGKVHAYEESDGHYTGADNECDYEYSLLCSRCGDSYSVTTTSHDWTYTTIKTPTCTQYGLRRQTCSRCGRYDEYTISPYGHNFDRVYGDDGNIKNYKCSKCGLISETGSNSGDIIMEDVTGKVSGSDVTSDMYVVGYTFGYKHYKEEAEYGYWYDAVVNVVIHKADGSEDVANLNVYADRVLEEKGNYIGFSKTEAEQAAQAYINEMANEDSSYIGATYEIRFTFVSADNVTNYDYSITFSD